MSDIDALFASNDPVVRVAAAERTDISEAQLDQALVDKSWLVRKAAAGNPNASEAQLDQALGDEHWLVRKAAAGNPNASEAQLDQALGDKSRRSDGLPSTIRPPPGWCCWSPPCRGTPPRRTRVP